LIFDSDLISLFDVGILPFLVRALLKTSLAIRGSEYGWFSFSRKISILSAYFAQIQTMDARDTLKYTIGVDVVAEMLDLMPAGR
jgi:hypothetical protein